MPNSYIAQYIGIANTSQKWPESNHCLTRDVFQARLHHQIAVLKQVITDENQVYLLIAVIGEIGNNSFDHNSGNWPSTPGIYFDVDLINRQIAMADRGQGILATIKKVKPDVANSQAALHVAFTEIISGRAPEKRGNGLKFVARIIEEQCWQLNFYSGNAECQISEKGLAVSKSEMKIAGVLAIIKF